MRLRSCFLALLAPNVLMFGGLGPETNAAFDKYAQLTEQRMDRELKDGHFLVLGNTSRNGMVVQEDKRDDVEVPHGQIHHWLGGVFLPGVTLAQVVALKQDYEHYKDIYKPDVVDSRLIKRNGDEFQLYLKIYKKQVLSVVYDTYYTVRYYSPEPKRSYLRSYATKIDEVGKAPGEDRGFLWRLNSYWRLQEADGGVYVECEAVSLSRDTPALLNYIVGSFIKKFPAESMRSTLAALKKESDLRAPRRRSHTYQILPAGRFRSYSYDKLMLRARLAQLVRAFASHAKGLKFES